MDFPHRATCARNQRPTPKWQEIRAIVAEAERLEQEIAWALAAEESEYAAQLSGQLVATLQRAQALLNGRRLQ